MNSRDSWPAAGVRLAVLTFVATQFIEITLFSVGMFQVSVQKIAAAIFFPLSLILIRKARISHGLILAAILLLVVFSASYVSDVNLAAPELMSAGAMVLFNLLGAIVLYTALRAEKSAAQFLAKVWIGFSVATAVLTLLQAVRLFPLINVPAEFLSMRRVNDFLYRGAGLKFDPNFQALMLSIGMAFSRIYRQKGSAVYTGIIFLGVLGTFSRMGLVLAIAAVVVLPLLRLAMQGKLRRAMKVVTTALLLLTIAAVFVNWGPVGLRNYFQERIQDSVDTIGQLVSTGVVNRSDQFTSSQGRAILLLTTIQLIGKHWVSGVGVFQTNVILGNASGIQNVSHNSYLELILIGGVWGAVFLLFYVYSVLRVLRMKSKWNVVLQTQVEILLQLVIVLGVAGWFLSLTYNSILWLPLVLSFSMRALPAHPIMESTALESNASIV